MHGWPAQLLPRRRRTAHIPRLPDRNGAGKDPRMKKPVSRHELAARRHLDRLGDELVARMQTPTAKRGVRALFRATFDELGRAAAEAETKQHGPQQIRRKGRGVK